MAKEDNVLMEEQMKQRAAEGYFIRDIENDRVYCPMGEILRRKSNRKNGDIRYANKRVCKVCEQKDICTRSPWKEIDFPDGVSEVRNRNWLRAMRMENMQI